MPPCSQCVLLLWSPAKPPQSLPHPCNVLLRRHGAVCVAAALLGVWWHCREPMERQGVDWKGRLFISDRAHVLFPFHRTIDGMLEQSLATTGQSIGTTKKVVWCMLAYCSFVAAVGAAVGAAVPCSFCGTCCCYCCFFLNVDDL